ncbi:uncharacterized protein VTP21DRAFT_9992 [Calcarisporiella thermophila]|uniref:uncharacterized protein n=1 Tax=Calcarisporiella thermophila TaxID=911321 RepID=UPI0037447905
MTNSKEMTAADPEKAMFGLESGSPGQDEIEFSGISEIASGVGLPPSTTITVSSQEKPDGGMEKEEPEVVSSHSLWQRSRRYFIVLAYFLICFHIFGYNYTYGIYQQLFLNDIWPGMYTRLRMSFVGTMGQAFMFGVGPFTPYLMHILGPQGCMFVGACLMPLGLLLASFVTEQWQLYFTLGIMYGVGSGLLFYPIIGILPQYFVKNRGLAMGIGAAGSGIGGLALSPMTQYLIDRYDFRWSLRIVAIMSFVAFVISSSLTKPLSSLKGRKLWDRSLFRETKFIALFLYGTFIVFGYIVPFYLMPAYAEFIGLDRSTGALVVGIMAGVNAFGRVLLGIGADYIGYINTLFLSTFLAAVSILVIWTFSTSYGILMFFAILYGIMGGGFISLFPVVVAGVADPERLGPAMGLTYATNFFGNLFGTPLCGAILDSTQPNISYLGVQMFSGMVTLVSAAMALWLRFIISPQLLKAV